MEKNNVPLSMDLEYIQFRISCGLSLLRAVQEAVEYGGCAAGNYSEALFGLLEYLSAANEDLEQYVDECLKEKKRVATAKEVAA